MDAQWLSEEAPGLSKIGSTEQVWPEVTTGEQDHQCRSSR
jgi:hypothetical protein